MRSSEKEIKLVKYLFFYLKTGGGHIAPAKAVAQKIRYKRGDDIEIILADGLAGCNKYVRWIIEDGYRITVNNVLLIFELLYALHKIKLVAHITAGMVSYFIKPVVNDYIERYRPEKILIFHFFIIKPVVDVVNKIDPEIKVITVVTDPFTAHPLWFLNKSMRFIVFSEMLKETCIKKGIRRDNVNVFPFVVDQRFSKPVGDYNSRTIRRSLGFQMDSKIILIMGGGDGLPKGKKIIKALITSDIEAEIAVVCGNNTSFFDYVTRIRRSNNLFNLKIYKFIDFVPSLISISDIVITKCGASTFMEILLMGKVPVISNYIWEQEKGNMEFVCKGKMGILEKNTDHIPKVVNKLLFNKELYNMFSNNIRKASLSNGVNEVSDFVLNYC